MFPTVSSGPLRCTVKDEIVQGITLKKGTKISLSSWTMHHDPAYFNDPDTFNPDRFAEENRSKINMNAFRPFTSGMHQCIGYLFAYYEMKVILTELLRRFHFQVVPGHKVIPVEYVTLKPKHGLMMHVHPRNPASLSSPMS